MSGNNSDFVQASSVATQNAFGGNVELGSNLANKKSPSFQSNKSESMSLDGAPSSFMALNGRGAELDKTEFLADDG